MYLENYFKFSVNHKVLMWYCCGQRDRPCYEDNLNFMIKLHIGNKLLDHFMLNIKTSYLAA